MIIVSRCERIALLPSATAPDPVVVRSTIANAFALLGGRIYVLSGLLKISETPNEVAGVLSHELSHVADRDGLRRPIQDGGTSFLVGRMFGDLTGPVAVLRPGTRCSAQATLATMRPERIALPCQSCPPWLGPPHPLGGLLQRIIGLARPEAPSIMARHPPLVLHLTKFPLQSIAAITDRT
jgi:hypothetical protein